MYAANVRYHPAVPIFVPIVKLLVVCQNAAAVHLEEDELPEDASISERLDFSSVFFCNFLMITGQLFQIYLLDSLFTSLRK